MQSPKYCKDWKEVRTAMTPFLKKASSLFVLVDSNTAHHCLPLWLAEVPQSQGAEILEIEPGESSKDWAIAGHLLEHLAECRADRHALLINLGGGVVTDVGGFVASIYKRGIAYVHVPTSLMGMADAAIGGKNGLDLGSMKNLIGTFSQPNAVIVHPSFLATLPEQERRSGWFEMIKHGIIADRSHFEALMQAETPFASRVGDSAAIKWKLVKQDVFETKDIRVYLNFGHSIGHAYESLCLGAGSPIPHGFAVGWGMVVEAIIARNKGILSEHDAQIISNVVLRQLTGLHPGVFSMDEVAAMIGQDKKNKAGEIRMALPAQIGKMHGLCTVSMQEVDQAWQESVEHLSAIA
jgi:3-dehydroquinate synthase